MTPLESYVDKLIDKLKHAEKCVADIQKAILAKGVYITDATKFSDYAAKILLIKTIADKNLDAVLGEKLNYKDFAETMILGYYDLFTELAAMSDKANVCLLEETTVLPEETIDIVSINRMGYKEFAETVICAYDELFAEHLFISDKVNLCILEDVPQRAEQTTDIVSKENFNYNEFIDAIVTGCYDAFTEQVFISDGASLCILQEVPRRAEQATDIVSKENFNYNEFTGAVVASCYDAFIEHLFISDKANLCILEEVPPYIEETMDVIAKNRLKFNEFAAITNLKNNDIFTEDMFMSDKTYLCILEDVLPQVEEMTDILKKEDMSFSDNINAALMRKDEENNE